MGRSFLTIIAAFFSVATTLSSCTTNAAKGEKPKPYPFDYCAVVKKPFDEEEGAKYRREYDGYYVGFCCAPCVKAFESQPEAFMGPIREFYSRQADQGAE
ncbi:MAG: hypothetical protein P1V20_18410 [Verrucomicrobiales bacterium]|nr:hypothetical protein [Verrucomicrobiales bacterium]